MVYVKQQTKDVRLWRNIWSPSHLRFISKLHLDHVTQHTALESCSKHDNDTGMKQFLVGDSANQSPLSTPARRRSPHSSHSTFDDDYDDDEDTLPYPTELPRADFLSPDFDPQVYLSGLRNRHQTLEDLRSDLRQRSQQLNKELLDLVNGNYEEFLSLGRELRGGEEKVEGVRVGVLGFQREVDGVRKTVNSRVEEMGDLLAERKRVRRDVALARALLEVHGRIEDLEHSLGLGYSADSEDKDALSDGEEDDYEDEDGMNAAEAILPHIPFKKLQRHTIQYLVILRQIDCIGPQQVLLQAQRSKLDEARRTILVDLGSALRAAQSSKREEVVLGILRMYDDLGAPEQGLRVLKGR